jgi:tetratricopeptide (TPR) repeat protein
MKRILRTALGVTLAFACLLLAPMAVAQTGSLSGKVLDLEGKPAAGTKVTITNKNTAQSYSTNTDSNGLYSQANLIPGVYSVKFESAQGQGDTQDVTIDAGETTLVEDFRTAAAREGGASTGDAGKQRTMANSSAQMKGHVKNGNDALHDAQELRKQMPMAKSEEKAALQTKMKTDFQTAVDEYQAALNILVTGDTNKVEAMGLIGVQRNGLVDQQKATQMLVQDKNVPILLTNLGLAYSGLEDYVEAINVLQQATTMKAEPSTYMQLGTDLAAVGKVSDGMATCDKIPSTDPAATELLDGCYKNIAILLMNANKMADAVAPLQKATQLNPKDATAWKMLGDSLSNSITTKEANGKTVYVIPPGIFEAYRHYLELEPNGVYAAQVKATLDGFEQLQKSQ